MLRSWQDGRSGRCGYTPLLFLLDSFVHQVTEVLAPLTHTLGDLDYDTAAFELELFSVIKFPVSPPMRVSDVVASLIVNHEAFVEQMILEPAILPTLLLSFQIMREET